jgi:hypothetical protein
VIEAPATTRIRLVADPDLALHEQPALPLLALSFPYEQIGMVREKLLEYVFGVVRPLRHFD